MASVSPRQTSSATISAEFGYHPRTPASESKLTWHRHWSLRSNTQRSPTAASEGKSHFFGTLRGRSSCQNLSASENGSPTKPERRKSIADLFDDIPSPKKPKERTWSFSGKTTRSRSTSPAKAASTISEPGTPSKRRKSISSLFSTNLRHAILDGSTDKKAIIQQNKFELISPQEIQSHDNEHSREKEVTMASTAIPGAANIPPVYRLRPIPRVQFATSDADDDPFEPPPKGTTVSFKEVSPPVEKRRSCSESTGLSTAPTLVAEGIEGSSQMLHSDDERPRTPDSYLQLLIESCECSSEVSSSGRTELSPTPSPAKHQAVQPLDFLADIHTIPLNDDDSQKLCPSDFRSLPSAQLCRTAKKESLPLKYSNTFQFSSLEKSENSESNESLEESLPNCNDDELTWAVGDIDTNFRQRLQERNERYKILESGSVDCAKSALDREYIARSIKSTVAKMAKNYYLDQSSDEHTPVSMTDDRISIADVVQFDKYLGPRMSRSYQFGTDSDDVRDSMFHGRLMMEETQKELPRFREKARIPSPILEVKSSVVGKQVLDNSIHDQALSTPLNSGEKHGTQATFEEFKQQHDSVRGNIRRSDSSSSDEETQILNFIRFVDSLVRDIPASTEKIASSGSEGSSTATSAARKTNEMQKTRDSKTIDTCKPMFRDQADPTWLEETLGIYSTCPQIPPFYRTGGSTKSVRWSSPLSVIEATPGISAEPRSLEDNTNQPDSRYQSITVPRTSLSGRRRVVSTAAVYVQFPAIKNISPQLEKFDNRSEAVAALFDYKLGQLSNHVIYDPVKRIFHAQDLGSLRPDPAKLEESGLELLWFPLQSGSLSQASASGACADRNAQPADQDNERPRFSEPQERDALTRYLVNRSSPKVDTSISDSESSDSDFDVHTKWVAESSKTTVETQAVPNSKPQKSDWTPSDEEYVIGVDSGIIRSCLDSEDSESRCSTPKLESGTLIYPNVPRILLDGEEILYDYDDEISLKRTKTWPQLGKEFKEKHPELSEASEPSILDETAEFDNCDADSESSSDSDIAWLTKARSTCNLVTELFKTDRESGSTRENHIQTKALEIATRQSRIGAFNEVCRSSNEVPSVEHVENVGLEHQEIADEHKDKGDLRTPTLSAEAQSNRSTSEVQDVSPAEKQAGDQDAPLMPDTHSLIQSWAEAERAQARLFQPDPAEHAGKGTSYGLCGNTATSAEIGQVGLDTSKETARPVLTQSKSAPAISRSQSILTSRHPPTVSAVNVSSTPGSETTLHCSHTAKDDGVLGATANLQAKDCSPVSLIVEMRHGSLLKLADGSPTSWAKSNNRFVSKIAVPSKSKMTEKSGLLEAVPVRDFSAVTPEDLNLRLVGKGALQSELAKSSKVSTLIDVFKARGLMSQTMKPVAQTTTTSPGFKNQPERRATLSTRIVTPPGNIYRTSENVERANIAHFSQTFGPVKRTPTPASSDADTEHDDGFGEELVRVEKHS